MRSGVKYMDFFLTHGFVQNKSCFGQEMQIEARLQVGENGIREQIRKHFEMCLLKSTKVNERKRKRIARKKMPQVQCICEV